MKFYIDLASRRFVKAPNSPVPLQRVFLKRRDIIDVEVFFVDRSAIVPTPAGTTLQTALKRSFSDPQSPAATAAATLGKAIVNWTASGFHATPPDILAAREATCRACPEWDATAMGGTGRCAKCGCSTWAKLRMATERCPLGKW